jgi:hypothetical protein
MINRLADRQPKRNSLSYLAMVVGQGVSIIAVNHDATENVREGYKKGWEGPEKHFED